MFSNKYTGCAKREKRIESQKLTVKPEQQQKKRGKMKQITNTIENNCKPSRHNMETLFQLYQ